MDLTILPYSRARDELLHGDVLLRRYVPGRMAERVIARAGASPYCHAAMMGCWENRLMLIEMTSWYGGSTRLLSRAVEAYSGRWDVWRVPDWNVCDQDDAVSGMIDILGIRYGWATICYMAPFHLPVVRHWMRTDTNDLEPSNFWVCSTAVARASREFARTDLVPNLADRAVEPGDLARGGVLKYQFTIGEYDAQAIETGS